MINALNPNSRVAVYSRKSRGEDESVLSKDRSMLNDFILKSKLSNVTWYEEVVTGTSIDERHEFIRLLNDIENFKYDVILTIDMDRITRGDTYERGLIERVLKNSQTLIYTLDGELIDYNDANQALSANVKGLLANFEASQITKRMINGKKDTVKKGIPHSGLTPYGYKWDRNSRSVYIDEEEKKAYRMMLEWYINDGLSFKTISDKLNSMNIKTAKGGKWYPERVSKTLQNDFHLGYVVYGEYKREKTGRFNDKGKMIYRIIKNEDVESVKKEKGNHEPMKTPEEHAKIMKRILEHKLYGVKQSEVNNKAFKLKSLIRCPHCNLAVGVINQKNKATQIRKCTKPSKHRTLECDKTQGVIEDALYQGVIVHLREYKDRLFAKVDDINNESQKSIIDLEISSIEKAIATHTKNIEKEKEMYRADVIDIVTLKDNIEKIEDAIKKLEDELVKLKLNQSYLDKSEVNERIEKWSSQDVIDLLENPFGKFDDKAINDILKLLVHSISYVREGERLDISIVYK